MVWGMPWLYAYLPSLIRRAQGTIVHQPVKQSHVLPGQRACYETVGDPDARMDLKTEVPIVNRGHVEETVLFEVLLETSYGRVHVSQAPEAVWHSIVIDRSIMEAVEVILGFVAVLAVAGRAILDNPPLLGGYYKVNRHEWQGDYLTLVEGKELAKGKSKCDVRCHVWRHCRGLF